MTKSHKMIVSGLEYTVLLCDSAAEYYREVADQLGWKWLIGFTDSRYPRFLARGVWIPETEEGLGKHIIVWKTGDWKLRLWHEIGHAVGFKHVSE